MWFVKVGNRVTGPFNEGEMRARRRCKELSQFHLISRDGVRWESAAQLVKLLDDPSAEGGAPSAQWHYVDATRKRIGPVPQDELISLLRSRQLSGKTLVCKVGEMQWGQAAHQPELASFVPKTMGPSVALATSVTVILMMAGGSAAYRLSSHRPPAQDPVRGGEAPAVPILSPVPVEPGGKGESGTGPITTLSATAGKQLDEAVGLVVCGWDVRWKDGDVEQERESSGSCFAASPDGYLVTNKHVIEDIIKVIRADDQYRIAIYCVSMQARLEKARRLIEEKHARKEIETADANNRIKSIQKEMALNTPANFQKVEPKIWVFFGSKEQLYEAEIVHVSSLDMGVLKVKRKGVSYFRMADSGRLPKARTPVWALGFPGAAWEGVSAEEILLRRQRERKNTERIQDQFYDYDFIHSSDPGEVSRIIPENQNGMRIQHSAPIKHGNSGGPLVTSDGLVVGINTWGVKAESDPSGIQYALAMPQLLDEIARAIESDRASSGR